MRVGAAAGLLKMAAGRRQTTKLASVPTTTPKPHAPLKGCSLVPLVAEACAGGWAPAATSWKLLARAVAGRTGESVSVLTERLQQTLTLTLQRENARAVLRRAGDAISPTVSFGIALACLSLRPIC